MDQINGQEHYSPEHYPQHTLSSHQIPIHPQMPSQVSDQQYQPQQQAYLPDGSVGGEYGEVYHSPEVAHSLPQVPNTSSGFGQQQPQQHVSSTHTTPGPQPSGLPPSRSSSDLRQQSLQYPNPESNIQPTQYSPQVQYSPMGMGGYNANHHSAHTEPSRELKTDTRLFYFAVDLLFFSVGELQPSQCPSAPEIHYQAA